MKFIVTFPILAAALAFATACDDDTAAIGTEVIPGNDNIQTSQATYLITSRSIAADSVLANTNDCFLGSVIDPESHARTTCGYLAQFHVMENYRFPERSKMIADENGNIVADSCDIRLYIESFYGDSLTTMKMRITELDTARVMEENVPYYSNIDPTYYIGSGHPLTKELTYSVKDLTRPDSLTDGVTYVRSIPVRMPAEYGSFILNKYYENPSFFQNSYQFVHHVCPGFYIENTGGIGSLIKTKYTTMNIYFRYHDTTAEGNDTIVDGMHQMGATQEVIQNTRAQSRIPAAMLDNTQGYTYLKSPAGIFTELELPVGDIVAGEHYNDTINSASLTLFRLNDSETHKYGLSAPGEVLLIRKSETYSFFEKEKLTGTAAYLTSFSSNYNSYTFGNISQLINILKYERDLGAGVTKGDSEAERNAKYAQWEALPENKDWNKVVIIPVKAEYSTSTSYYGTTTKTLSRIRNSFEMNSAKLKGGTDAIELHVIYSRFQ